MRGIVALFVRSLRQDARGLPGHLLRGGMVGMMVIIMYSMMDSAFRFSAPGLRVFQAVLWINFMFISLAAIGYFATSITEEKEEGTLGLLRMAGISPAALLMGKSVTRLWLAVVLIAIQFPFALLAITLGGVSLRQVQASYVALGAYTFFLSGMATLCSVASKQSVRAVVYMAILSVALLNLPGIMDAIDDLANTEASVATAERIANVTEWVRHTSIRMRLSSVMTVAYDDPIIEEHFIASIVGGLFFFLLAWLFFDFFTNRHVANAPSRDHKLRRRLKLSAGRARQPALTWKDFHFGANGYYGWILRAIGLFGVATIFTFPTWYYDQRFEIADFGAVLFPVTLVIWLIESTVQSIRFLADEHSQQTLPLLAMTPSSKPKVLYSKALGFVVAMLPYVIGVFLAIVMKPAILSDFLDQARQYPDMLMGYLYFVVLVGVFLHSNAFLASYMKWAAPLLSFGILLALNMCCVFTFISGPGSRGTVAAMFFLLSLMGLGAMGVLQLIIGERFEDLKGR